jgi:hypothetical protein
MTLATLSDRELDVVSGGHPHAHRDVDVNVSVIAHSTFTFGAITTSGTNAETAIVIGGAGNIVTV